MRILHVVVNMNRGGAETLIMNLYRNIDRSIIQFDFLTCKEGVFDREILEMGGKVYRIPYITDVGHFRYNNELLKFYKRNSQYKIVHSHMDRMSGFVLRAARKANIPIRIAHSHSTQSEGGFASRIYKWYAGQFIKSKATNYMACSQVAGDWLFGSNLRQLELVKNGVELEKFNFCSNVRTTMRNELGLDENTLVVGHVGRFSHPKNHIFLVDIFYKLMKKNPNSVLVLAGDGPLKNEINQKVKNLNITKNVRFLGVRADIDRILQSFDIFVFPSLYEGLPVTLIEAQAVGLPCLVADTVTDEVNIDEELVKFLALQDADKWVEQILISSKKVLKKSCHKALKTQGYDISTTANWLQHYYSALL